MPWHEKLLIGALVVAAIGGGIWWVLFVGLPSGDQ